MSERAASASLTYKAEEPVSLSASRIFETVCLASRHPADVGGFTTCARSDDLVLQGHCLWMILASCAADKQRIFAVRRTGRKGYPKEPKKSVSGILSYAKALGV